MKQIAVMGFGTVGSGVVEVIEENAENIARKAGVGIEVKYILTRREYPDSPYRDKIIQDFSIIEDDPEVAIVVETIGGVDKAYEYTRRSLTASKSVVTANKELVATRGLELLALAEENNANYMFEASVGGGIPIIRTIKRCLSANDIDEVYGIINGTTNYILTSMEETKASFRQALSRAQELGYAELDPTADVAGHDACRKICILADLCFGKNVDPSKVKTTGITKITTEDVELAGSYGYRIKLLGRAAAEDGKENATVYVAPHLVSMNNLLSGVSGAMNAIVVHGNVIGQTMFYGAGAGKRPTASAVVADVIDATRYNRSRKRDFDWEAAGDDYLTDSGLLESRWFIRGPSEAYITESMNAYQAGELAESKAAVSLIRVLD